MYLKTRLSRKRFLTCKAVEFTGKCLNGVSERSLTQHLDESERGLLFTDAQTLVLVTVLWENEMPCAGDAGTVGTSRVRVPRDSTARLHTSEMSECNAFINMHYFLSTHFVQTSIARSIARYESKGYTFHH